MPANAAAQSNNASPFEVTSQNSQSKPASLSHQAIIWLVVLSCIVVAAFIIITCLLCKCRKSRRANGRIERGYSVSDGRNDFQAWNKSAQQPPIGATPPVPQYSGYGAGVTPLAKATVRPTQAGSAVMEPIIVEDAGEGNGYDTQRRKVGNNRYYSAWAGRISHRFSQQIGTAV